MDKFLLKERVKNLGLFHWEGAEKSINEIYSTEALKRAGITEAAKRFGNLCSLLHRKDRKGDMGNHRPVSLTSMPKKVIEQLILGAISKHIEDKKVAVISQNGFIKGKLSKIDLIAF